MNTTTSMETINTGIELISQNTRRLEYKVGDQKFSLIRPTRLNKKYNLKITSIVDGYEWMFRLNREISEGTELGAILEKISMRYDENFSTIPRSQKQEKPKKQIKDAEILQYLDRVKKASFLETTTDDKKRKIFTEDSAVKILTDEFLKMYKKYKDCKYMELTLENDCLTRWSLKFKSFNKDENNEKLKELNSTFGYDYVKVILNFSRSYPNYPPSIELIKPLTHNNLMFRFKQLKMVNLDYWNPCRKIEFIIKKLYTILENNLEINYSRQSIGRGEYSKLDIAIAELSSLTDDVNDTLDPDQYNRLYNFSNTAKVSSEPHTEGYKDTTVWNSGVGYATSSEKIWDSEAYLKLVEERDEKIRKAVRDINDALDSSRDEISFNLVSSSITVPFISSKLDEYNDVQADRELFKEMCKFLSTVACHNGLCIFQDHDGVLYKKIKKIYNEIKKIQRITNKIAHGEDCSIVSMLYNILDKVLKEVDNELENLEQEQTISSVHEVADDQDESEVYVEKITPYSFDTVQFSKFTDFSKMNRNISSGPPTKKLLTRINKEMITFSKDLPITYPSSVFVRMDENNTQRVKVLITGPDNTPYDSGCFIFDVYMPSTYPNTNPKMWFLNHGGRRFNPNLYNNGKVCLSMLGTWGDNQWDPKTSTLLQLFISVQAQILVEDPYYNEPGYERNRTKIASENYNDNIRVYTIVNAIHNLLAHPNMYPEFEDVIQNHFRLKKNYIIKMCSEWHKKARISNNKSIIGQYIPKIVEHLKKL